MRRKGINMSTAILKKPDGVLSATGRRLHATHQPGPYPRATTRGALQRAVLASLLLVIVAACTSINTPAKEAEAERFWQEHPSHGG